MGSRAQVGANIDEVIAQVMAQVQPGDQLLCMSNGGFGGIHAKLLAALSACAPARIDGGQLDAPITGASPPNHQGPRLRATPRQLPLSFVRWLHG